MLAILCSKRHQKILKWIIPCILVLAGYVHIQVFQQADDHPLPAMPAVVRIVEKKTDIRFTARLYAVFDGNHWQRLNHKILLTYAHDPPLRVGELVFINGRADSIKASNGDFDFHEYYKNLHITHQVYADTAIILQNPKGLSIRLRSQITDRLKQMLLRDDVVATVMGIALGDRKLLSDKMQTAYQRVGGMHVLAVSGMHVSILFLLIQTGLKIFPQFSVWKWIKFLIPVMLLWIYAAITGFSPSVLRAVLFLTFFSLGRMVYRPVSIGHTLSITAFVVWIADPSQAFTVGFQLSYGAVCGIALFQPIFEKAISGYSGILTYFLRILTVSISAQALTWPLIIFYFGGFSAGGILFSIILIPAVFAILCLTLIGLAAFDLPLISGPVFTLLSEIVTQLNEAVFIISEQSEIYQFFNPGFRVFLLAGMIIFPFALLMRYPGRFSVKLVILCCICAFLIPKEIHSANEIRITPGHTGPVITFSSQGRLLVISDKKLPVKQGGMKVKRFQYSKYPQQLYKFGSHRIFITRKLLPQRISADIIIICGGMVPDKTLIECPEVIVLSSGLSYLQRRKWKQWAVKSGCKIHDLRAMGTYIKSTGS